MATEVQSGDLNSANSSRLEVSIDGLTLSPDSEGEQEQAETPAARSVDQNADNHVSVDGEEGEPAIEKKWGFDLIELYGLALRFFKGILCTLMLTYIEHKHSLARSSLCYSLNLHICLELVWSWFSY